MASLIRKIMRGIRRNDGARMQNGAVLGTHRAGMHQKSEHEYQRSRMAEAVPPELETVEDGLDMLASVEAEIPPAEEEDDEIVESIAEGEADVAADEGILEEIAEPQAEIAEEEEGGDPETEQLSVDYSGEKIPVMDVVTGGTGVDPSTPLEYTSQDGSVKEIQEPLPGMDRYGVAPYVPGMEDPSANVAAAPEAEPEPEPDPEPEVPDPEVPEAPGE